MSRLLRSIWAVVITGVTLLPAAAVAEPTDEHVLIVGISRGRSSDARLVKGLGEHLQRSGLLLTGESLPAADRACESPDCIGELARRQGAQLVLTARLQDNPPSTVFITMALFDAVRRAPFQATALCDPCSQESLLGKLSDVADKLIRQSREARETPVAAPLTPVVPVIQPLTEAPEVGISSRLASSSLVATTAPRFSDRLSRRRKIVIGVLGSLAGAALITAIALTATDDQPTSLGCMMSRPELNLPCRLDNRGLYAASYAASGALAVGVGLTLFWPANNNSSSPAEGR